MRREAGVALSVIDALTEVCGPEHVRTAGPGDAVDGIPAGFVAAPADAEELGGLLRVAAEQALAVLACGAGTKLDWGVPPAHLDLIVDTTRLAGVYDHAPDDRLATVGAGTPLRAVRAGLARAGQRVPLDVPSPGATVGGVLATNESGPLRLTHGTPRDLIAHARVALADGTVTDRVAGHDLPRLVCGSYGAFGVIAEATLRLDAVPAARRWVTRAISTPREVQEFAAALLGSSLSPEAIEADLPAGAGPGELAVLVEGDRLGAQARAQAMARILGGDAGVGDTPPIWWGRYPFAGDDIAVRVVGQPTELFAVIYALRDAAGVPVRVRGSVATGTAHVALPSSMTPAAVRRVLGATRDVLLVRGGGLAVLLRAPLHVRDGVESYGGAPLANELSRAKAELDPDGRLAPGRRPER